MNYKCIYDSLITNSLHRFSCTSDSMCSWRSQCKLQLPDRMELYHIIPRCLQGRDIASNYCMLTLREHFIAHKLLYKLNKSSKSIIFAFRMMCSFRSTNKMTSKEYELLKTRFIEKNSGIHNHATYKIGNLNHFYGKHHTIESKEKISKSMKNNTHALISASNRISNRNKANTGDRNNFYGKQHTKKTKLSVIETDIQKGKTRPFIYNNQLFLSLHIASKLLQYNRKSITRLIKQREENKYIESSDFFNSYTMHDFEWQVDPSSEMIEKFSRMNTIYLDSIQAELKTTAWNKSIRILNSYIESEYNNLDTYAKSIGLSDCGLAYQFKRFPQYTTISNGCKQFTKEKAIELLNSIA